ncbi:hypothetical protein [Runella slithyformis]|uniref:Uncharacterized protein n=1 Tax=Runella slithyformis (strain ATCC 29530 / DSM 19594 / LMG 11500 / NCIMB 11436 / LSU 4) TaxID=761193 RepID=A0A7U3ZM90_RUNSL|nr:hypothetical protein [Runella slithyformis]AEI49820.1 hypothetical protein Runsl_3454 [Runella slithyformis DSM 19594]
MKKPLLFSAVVLLLFNGISALYGGGLLVIDPSGAGLQLPLSYLHYSPFSDYLIPGIVLLGANGLLSLVTAVLAVIQHRYYTHFIILQGVILCGWIFIQVVMVRDIYYLHYIMGTVGLLLTGLGIILFKKEAHRKKNADPSCRA